MLTVSMLPWCDAPIYAGSLFLGLGDLPGGNFFSEAHGVSADGSVVVGVSNREPSPVSGSPREGFRWTQATGMVGLGVLPGGFDSESAGVSADGAVVVGNGNLSTGRRQGTRWTEATGQVALGVLAGHHDSFAVAASADGSVVVGRSVNAIFGTPEAFRWTQATGLVGLGFFPGSDRSEAAAVSADGSVVVGNSANTAFRWTQSDGMVNLGSLPGGPGAPSFATGISADGSVIVGQARDATNTRNRAFRWTQTTGMVDLGSLDGFHSNVGATAVSGDGSVVIGVSESTPFIWDAAHGMRDLQDVLTNEFDLGDSLTGWQLTRATALSHDGRTIVGFGTNPNGDTEAWIANLVPEPSLPAPVVLTLAAGANLRRRRRVFHQEKAS